jgi:hypothetical protein
MSPRVVAKRSSSAEPHQSKPLGSPSAPQASIDRINALLSEAKNILDGYSLFIRTLDYRFNEGEDGKLNYLGQAYELAMTDDDFLQPA